MSYLLDTCILSIARKASQNAEILKKWLNRYAETSFFISAISIGEIQMGISKIHQEDRPKKEIFESWLLGYLIPRFEGRILDVDRETCLIWGQVRGEAQKKGKPIPAIDALIAASALQHRMVLVTENTKDFLATGVSLVNPLH